MSYLPPDMDRLLWIVAESNDPKTVAQFEAENPTLIAELAKRVAMVQALRNAKPGAIGGFGVPPEFHPRTPRGIPRPVLYGSGALAFAALALASFYITSAMLNPPRQPAVAPQPVHDRTPIVLPQDGGRNVASVPPARTTPARPEAAPPVGTPSGQAPSPGAVQGRSGVDRFAAPEEGDIPALTLKLESAPLLAVIQAIATQGGLEVQVAPGFENRTVSVDIAGKNAMHLLQTLGKQHGFTVFDEGDQRILVIPAVDGGPEPLNEG